MAAIYRESNHTPPAPRRPRSRAGQARVAIIGNAGAGKTTLARALAELRGVPHLELDAIVWEPGQIAEFRPPEAIVADLEQLLSTAPGWVAEGCCGEIVTAVLRFEPELLFLNPGLDACVRHSRQRSWAPQHLASPDEQRALLETLLDWIEGYYHRNDPWSLAAHRALFESYPGPKRELASPAEVESFLAEHRRRRR